MTVKEACEKLDLDGEGATVFAGLCARGCDADVLCEIVRKIIGTRVTLGPRKRRAGRRKRTRSGLAIEGGFAPIPQEAIGATKLDSPQVASKQNVAAWQPRNSAVNRPFKSRDLERLRKQLNDAAAEIDDLLKGSLARRALQQCGSPALNLTLSQRLRAYADEVIPALVESKTKSRSATDRSLIVGNKHIRRPKPRRQIVVSSRPLDEMRDALGRWNPRSVERLQGRLTRLAGQLRKLHGTKDVLVIVDSAPALSCLPAQIDRVVDDISAMLTTPIGPKRRPDFERLLWSLFNHVRARTGQYRDKQIAQILQDAGLVMGPSGEIDEFALAKWRNRHRQK